MCGITRTDAVVAHELTGIVDLTHGRSGTVYKNWLAKLGKNSAPIPRLHL